MYSQPLLPSFLCFLLALSSFQHIQGQPSSKLYIVYLGERKHDDPNHVTASHHDMLSSILGSKEEALSSIVYSYKHGFSGFAAMLTEYQAARIRELPEVRSIQPSGTASLLTTRSWDYLGVGLGNDPLGLLQRANFGEDVIIGVVDTGIWPESRSFDDVGYGPIPSRWNGTCQEGQSFNISHCNLKIIGARWYNESITALNLSVDDYQSPRDYQGHGTHTASTAAGSLVRNVSFHGLGEGTVRGGAPRARLAIYKACWEGNGCPDADVLKAVDDAIYDGVDVLSLSIGGRFYLNFATLHAVARGITVVFSTGNDGPLPQSLNNDLPWLISVAASTIDRSFPTEVTLGNNQTIVGQSLYYGSEDEGFRELFFILSCFTDSLNSTNMEGKIVVCNDSINAPEAIVSSARLANAIFAQIVYSLQQANAKGVIFARSPLGLLQDFQNFSCILVDNDVLWQINAYARSDASPVAKVRPAYNIVGSRVMSTRVAAFSSRGPSILFPDLIKPDITAPGVNILAAMFDSYAFDSGTSMSCPHVSGIVALLKNIHPKWSPAAIKSALVTTAYTTDAYGFPIEADGIPRKLADPFDYGGGHVDPNKAVDPGLVYDVDPNDYFKFFNCTNDVSSCGLVDSRLYHLNLPSVSISDLKTSVTVNRTVTNVGDTNSVYRAVVQSPPGVDTIVEPSILEFNGSKNTQTFVLTFKALRAVQGDFTFGSLTWTDGGNHTVRIPIAVRVIIQDYSITS
ncbi:subtilisin-like protease SBT3.10 [Zingiber officinale]|uniref:subtilisin-like protease SBT3.10 n=1 Tax=Zingiber officinale TaxID=94328 RepID=UPI001C4DD3E2|nr:subtilisin-like protease SBT3.10 [Zingiber officinale]